MIALVMTQEKMTKVIMEIQEVILQKLDINSSISDQTIFIADRGKCVTVCSYGLPEYG